MTIELGNRLAELRKEHGYSQEALADELGVSRQAISKWECGESSPDTDNLIELAKLYKISLDELVGNKPINKEETHAQEEQEVIDEDEDHDEDDKEEQQHPVFTKVIILLSCLTTLSVVITYVLLGTYLNLWGQAWTLFLLVAVIPSIVEMIFYKNMNKFVFPVFVAFIYLTLCVWYPGGLWHPLWVIFLSIPIYYAISAVIKKFKENK